MKKQITIEGVDIFVERKKIKNIYIRILPPDGQVKMTVPKTITDVTLMMFAKEKIDWIKKHQEKYENQITPAIKQYVTGEMHDLWGKKYQLEVEISGAHNRDMLHGDKII